MNRSIIPRHFMAIRVAVACIGWALVSFLAFAETAPPVMSAKELAARLNAAQQDGGSYDQILWPKERKGEAVLLRKAVNEPTTGSLFVPPDTERSLDASQMKELLFDCDLSYEDLVENFFAWDRQSIVGSGVAGGVRCQILESKPGKKQHSGS